MSKRYLHHVWAKLRPYSYWYFLAGFIVFGLLFVFNYRQNNINMIKLRDKVFVADEQNGDIEKSLRDLRSYVYGHMNTRLVSGPNAIKPPIQLKYQYERLVAKAHEWAATMAASRDVRHSNLTAGVGSGWVALGENVGCAGSVAKVHSLFMSSSVHRSLVLDPRMTKVGTGVAVVGGRVYVVQVFGA